MTVLQIILCLAFVSLAGCYGWGMRGTVIGGEKGAMLPGMFIALSLAVFSGGAIAEYFWIPAAAGLIGMTFGGIEPYGDTISFVIDDPPLERHDMKTGLTGLALKGALWFGVFGGITGMAVSAMGGRYTVVQLVLFILLCPIAQFTGYALFNTPVNPKAKQMPKISFAFESREEWGSNVGLVLVIAVFGIFAKDVLSLALLGFGIVFGAIGWLVAIFNYYRNEKPMKNGKYLFGKFGRNVGGWKLMEFTLGAIGGFGIALGYIIHFGEVRAINAKIAVNGLFSPLAKYDVPVFCAFIFIFLCLLAVNVYEYVSDKKGKKYNSFLMDCIERPFFNLIPLVFVLLGSVTGARLMTVFMLLYALALKVCFDRCNEKDNIPLAFTVYFGVSAAVLVLDIVLGGFPAKWLFFAGGLPYLLSETVFVANHRHGRKYKFLLNAEASSSLWVMIAQTIIIDVIVFSIL